MVGSRILRGAELPGLPSSSFPLAGWVTIHLLCRLWQLATAIHAIVYVNRFRPRHLYTGLVEPGFKPKVSSPGQESAARAAYQRRSAGAVRLPRIGVRTSRRSGRGTRL